MTRPGMNKANWRLVRQDGEAVVIEDVGPWDRHPTVTNDAEQVVEEVAQWAGGRRILYYDSDGELTELVHDGPRFVRFAFVASEGKEANKGGEDGV